MSLIRDNLMNKKGYSPYCAGIGKCSMPRTHFKDDQFHCHECGWISEFPQDFIQKYKEKWNINSGLPTIENYPNCKLCGKPPVMIPDSVSKPPYIVCDTHSCSMRSAPTTGEEWIELMDTSLET